MSENKNNKMNVGIIGCGYIFVRHLEAINQNSDNFSLKAICDTNEIRLNIHSKELGVTGYTDYKEMLEKEKGNINFVVIATPNSLHFEQAIAALDAGNDILIEKPIAFTHDKVQEISKHAEKVGRKAYAVLQVRYNNTLKMLKEAMDHNFLGRIYSISLIQRWQRPTSYFESWRADEKIGGRTLYEVGIHYMDIIQWIFGLPEVLSSASFSNKHKHVSFEDTAFAILKYPSGASGSLEVTIAAEPRNLECSIAVLGSEGYIKIGGNALNKIEEALFESSKAAEKWDEIKKNFGEDLDPNSYGTHKGSCPNHPTLYEEIAKGKGITIDDAVNSIKFIENFYNKEIK